MAVAVAADGKIAAEHSRMDLEDSKGFVAVVDILVEAAAADVVLVVVVDDVVGSEVADFEGKMTEMFSLD